MNNDTAVIYSQFSNGGIGVSLASQTWTQGAFGLSDEASNSLYSFQQWTPLTWNERAVREIAKALPTVCSAGVYYYAGRELEAGPVNGFAGAIHEYDTKAGSTGGALFEAGGGEGIVGGGGLIVAGNSQQGLGSSGLVYGGFGAHTPVASASVGQVGFESGIGVYGEGFLFGRGGGVGAYLSITPSAGCHQ